MVEIEFLDDQEPRPPVPSPLPARHEDEVAGADRSPRRPGVETIRTFVPAAVAVVSAALALVAPWCTAYRLAASGRSTGVVFYSGAGLSVDGWGRYPVNEDGAHGVRYGILFCVAAALLLAGTAASVLGRIRHHPKVIAVAPGVQLAAIGLLAGTVGAAALEVSSTDDDFRAQAADVGSSTGPDLHVVTGAMVWVGLAAVVAGLAAVVLAPVLRPATPAAADPVRESPTALAVPPGRPRYVGHADDEVLDA